MNNYIISYDLSKPGRNYDSLIQRIKSYGSWARLGGSAYIIQSIDSAVDVRNYLTEVLDGNDSLFVGAISAPAAWSGLGEEVSNWIINTLN